MEKTTPSLAWIPARPWITWLVSKKSGGYVLRGEAERPLGTRRQARRLEGAWLERPAPRKDLDARGSKEHEVGSGGNSRLEETRVGGVRRGVAESFRGKPDARAERQEAREKSEGTRHIALFWKEPWDASRDDYELGPQT